MLLIIYFAPGNKHLILKGNCLSVATHLDDGDAINFCKPAADKLFESAVPIYGSRLIAIVLSGMGSDGCKGAAKIANASGIVIAQDQATSAAWGMPAAVRDAGIANHILPIELIAGHVGLLLGFRSTGAAI